MENHHFEDEEKEEIVDDDFSLDESLPNEGEYPSEGLQEVDPGDPEEEEYTPIPRLFFSSRGLQGFEDRVEYKDVTYPLDSIIGWDYQVFPVMFEIFFGSFKKGLYWFLAFLVINFINIPISFVFLFAAIGLAIWLRTYGTYGFVLKIKEGVVFKDSGRAKMKELSDTINDRYQAWGNYIPGKRNQTEEAIQLVFGSFAP